MKKLTRNDLYNLADYEQYRLENRQSFINWKKQRQLAVGSDCTFYFENRKTIWWQIQEMLRIEKGGESQIDDELKAYSSLIPNGNELVATFMFEIVDKERRNKILAKLGGVEETAFIQIDNNRIYAKAEIDVDRTSSDGKSSSVHFVHFPIENHLQANFLNFDIEITIGFTHPRYAHISILSPNIRTILHQDFS